MKPTLYLSNWSSHKTPGMHGPGKKWSIMAAPRSWEIGDGIVNCLAPKLADLRAVQEGRIGIDEYRARYEANILRHHMGTSMLVPSHLNSGWRPGDKPPAWGVVRGGDTLCCACSRSEAAAGRCHRCWIAPMLVSAGWAVILDGREVTKEEADAGFDERFERFVNDGRAASLDDLSVSAPIGDC